MCERAGENPKTRHLLSLKVIGVDLPIKSAKAIFGRLQGYNFSGEISYPLSAAITSLISSGPL